MGRRIRIIRIIIIITKKRRIAIRLPSGDLTRIRAIASNSQVTRRFPFATAIVLIRGVVI